MFSFLRDPNFMFFVPYVDSRPGSRAGQPPVATIVKPKPGGKEPKILLKKTRHKLTDLDVDNLSESDTDPWEVGPRLKPLKTFCLVCIRNNYQRFFYCKKKPPIHARTKRRGCLFDRLKVLLMMMLPTVSSLIIQTIRMTTMILWMTGSSEDEYRPRRKGRGRSSGGRRGNRRTQSDEDCKWCFIVHCRGVRIRRDVLIFFLLLEPDLTRSVRNVRICYR